MDVFAVDSEGKQYDIEVQRADSGAEPKRTRYNSSLMDANYLDKSEKVTNLPESYVIFITEHDVLKGNKPIYTINRVIEETGQLFNDGSHIIIYVNSQIQDETALGRLMKDFYCTGPAEMHYPVLSQQSIFYKNGEGVTNMSKLVENIFRDELEEGRQEGRQEGCQEGREEDREEKKKEVAINMLGKKKYSLEEIADISSLSIEEVKKAC